MRLTIDQKFKETAQKKGGEYYPTDPHTTPRLAGNAPESPSLTANPPPIQVSMKQTLPVETAGAFEL